MRRSSPSHRDERCALVANVGGRAYAYLLGQYLGDGHISSHRRGVYRLRIAACDDYPVIREECELAMELVMPSRRIGRLPRTGCTELSCYSKHWPCLFPQHGSGPKHARPIVLEPWQEQLVLDQYPKELLRGLIHSDGWRGTNTVKSSRDPTKRYAYPRYQFSNRSADIREIFVRACDQLSIACRSSNAWTISIARREAVGALDRFVGPKQ